MKQDWIARQLRVEAIVGTFVLLVFLGLAYFTIILSRDAWFAASYSLDIAFDDVLGLRDGDTVVVRGMTIGKVKRLELKPDGVHVIAAIEQEPHLREGCRFKVVPSSILGGRYLEIEEGPDGAPELAAGTLLRGEEPDDLIGDAAEVMSSFKDGMIEGGIVSNIQATAESIRIITARMEAGQGTLGKLMSTNDQMYVDLSATAASLREITGRLEAGEGTLGKMLAKDDMVYEDLAATMKSLRSVSEKIDKGEGVIGRLVSNEELGVKVEEVIDEVRATVDDFRESSPVITFTSVFFGAF